ncbi:Variant surface glycoprotein [Trypanosoma congolense IL3000]|uniref:Variant surface glycoprotein n=1 Tax=Trypanosoma congolense (strain IL3000) TaxID=1068625 RepID=F9WAE1_TRYCI|nr:Variant surface glycoprotein [Trypanosoma congolense IL3000]
MPHGMSSTPTCLGCKFCSFHALILDALEMLHGSLLVTGFLAHIALLATSDMENEHEKLIFCLIRLMAEREPKELVFRNSVEESEIVSRIKQLNSSVMNFHRMKVGGSERRYVDKRSKEYGREIHKILEAALHLKAEADAYKFQAAAKRDSARANLKRVIYGDAMNFTAEDTDIQRRIDDNTSKENVFQDIRDKGKSCSGPGAGRSLINDYFCLCFTESHFGSNEKSYRGVCGDGIVETTWDDTKEGWLAKWHKNKDKGCERFQGRLPSPPLIEEALYLFNKTVEASHAKYHEKGVFGHHQPHDGYKNPISCDGTGEKKTCVNYKHVLSHGGIPWVNRLQNASEDLREMEDLVSKSESILTRLELLEQDAEQIYVEAKFSLHLPEKNDLDSLMEEENALDDTEPNSSLDDAGASYSGRRNFDAIGMILMTLPLLSFF